MYRQSRPAAPNSMGEVAAVARYNFSRSRKCAEDELVLQISGFEGRY